MRRVQHTVMDTKWGPVIRITTPYIDGFYDYVTSRIPFPDLVYINKSKGGPAWELKPRPELVQQFANILDHHGVRWEAPTQLPHSPKRVVGGSIEATQGTLRLQWSYIRDEVGRDYVKNLVKGMPTAKWNKAPKNYWSISVTDAYMFKETCEDGIDHIGSYSPEAKEILEDFIDNITNNETIQRQIESTANRISLSDAAFLDGDAAIDIDARLADAIPVGFELYPFQKAGVKFIEETDGRCLVGDDMGLGKTVQALAYLALNEKGKTLIVCPNNVKINWVTETERWLPDREVAYIKKGKDPIPDADIIVINYDLIAKQAENLKAIPFSTIICDESHMLKNEKAQRTIATMEIAERCDRAICLSGTPITSRPSEFFTTLHLLRPDVFNSLWKFRKRYCDAYDNGWGYDYTGASNLSELNGRVRQFMIRRLKGDVLKELPAKQRQMFPVELRDSERRDYDRTLSEWLAELQQYEYNGGAPPGFALNMLTDLRHTAGRLKTRAAIEYISHYNSTTGKPLVLFAHHRDVINMISRDLPDGYTIDYITGDNSAEERSEVVDRFQRGEIDVLICSTMAAKEGLTLTASDTVVFVEREWVPGWEEQAEDRVHRIGQDSDSVHAVYLTAHGTIDDKFYELVEEKRKVLKATLDGGDEKQREQLIKGLLQDMVGQGHISEETFHNLTSKRKWGKKT